MLETHMIATRHLSLVLVSISLITLAALWTGSSAIAADTIRPKSLRDAMPVKTERTSFAYEQCFNGCQQALDKALQHCVLSVDPEDQVAQSRCRQAAIDRFEQALGRCPVDTGRRVQR
jgi:hypothetical protein